MHNEILTHYRLAAALSVGVIVSAVLYFGLLSGSNAPFAHAQTADTPTPVSTTAPDDDSGVKDLPSIEGKLNPPKYPNMDVNLNRVVQQVESGQSTVRAAAANAPLYSEESAAVTIYIAEGYADAIVEFLEANGASPRNVGVDYIEAYIPVTLLAQASQQEGVISMRTITPPQPAQGTVISEGVSAHGATAWHDAGLKGQGVRIGIIDIGFEGYTTLMGSELPESVEARCYTDLGVFTFNLADCDNSEVDDHGTAVTEAAFDIAPEATYYIASPFSRADLQATVSWMIDHDVDVINMSLSWRWDGPGDGTSPFSESPLRAVDKAVEGGITWVNGAGNSAIDTWFGDFTDSDGDGWHNFNGDVECNEFDVDETYDFAISAELRWDDNWRGASRDMDLYLYRISSDTGELERIESDFIGPVGGEFTQDGGPEDDPQEFIFYRLPASGTYCLAVASIDGTAPAWIQLLIRSKQELNHHTLEGSIVSPAESANIGLLAVGATHWDNPNVIDYYSSRGPTPDERIKPDIVGVSNTTSATYDEPFSGTSASSPHVAGLAALVKQRYTEYTPQQVASYLKTHAAARGAVPNNTWGYGFARLLASDAATSTPEPTASPEPSPTPDPSATPEPTDPCIEEFTDSTTFSGTWASDCDSVDSADEGGNRYARFYAFNLSEAANVTVTLESSEDTYLNIRQGTGKDGTVLHYNDDHETDDFDLDSSTDSGISENLSAGDYTIEATAYTAETTGDFTLTATISSVTEQQQPTPSPTPTPEPTPSDYDIKEYACDADDLSELEGYSFEREIGPNSYEDAGYTGVMASYWINWFNEDADANIACSAIQYDSIQNARWSGLNYSTIIQSYGVSTGIRYHEHAPHISPRIGDDMLGLWLGYQYDDEEDSYTAAEVRFLDSATRTVTRVFFYFRNSDEYPDLDQTADIVRNIAARVLLTVDDDSQSQSNRSPNRVLQSFDLLE